MEEETQQNQGEQQKKKLPEILIVAAWVVVVLIILWGAFVAAFFFSYSEKGARGINQANARTVQTALEASYASKRAYCSEDSIACGEYSFEETFRRLYSYNKYENIKQNKWCKSIDAAGGGKVIVTKDGYTLMVYDGKCINELKDRRIVMELGGSESNDSVESWQTYENKKYGFSFKYPLMAYNSLGDCERITENGSNSYQPKGAMVPVKIYEENDITIVDFEYSYQLKDEKKQIDGTTKYGSCEKVTNNFKNANSESPKTWRIKIAKAESDIELNEVLKVYGSACSLGEKKLVSDGLYRVSMDGDGLDLGATKCPVNYGTAIFYASEQQRVYYWDLGQSPLFFSGSDVDSITYDPEMVKSFKLIN